MPSRPPLFVSLYGHRVARLDSTRPAQVVCRYTEEALDTWPSNIALLSCSLPLSSRPHRNAGWYFRGLLPEGRQLQGMAAEANVASYDTFGLLARFGRDVAGAAVIAESEPAEGPGSAAAYTTESLAAEVAGLEERPLAIYDDSELSLAGLQNKLLLVGVDGGWGRPVGGRPSTHILKVEDRRYPGLVAMEGAAMRLARSVGLTSVDVEVQTLSGLACLIISRFDRATASGGGLRRVHQEDACQAVGRDPEGAGGRAKYQAHGGPSLVEIAGILDRYALEPVQELRRLVAAITFTVLIGNADAHGKNVSFLYDQPGQLRLAPLYDTVPTALWTTLPRRAAMPINGRLELAAVTADDVVSEAASWRLSPDDARQVVSETVDALRKALDKEEVPESLLGFICNRIKGFSDRS